MLGISVGGRQSGGITAGTHGVISVSKLVYLSVESASARSNSNLNPGGWLDGLLMKRLNRVSWTSQVVMRWSLTQAQPLPVSHCSSNSLIDLSLWLVRCSVYAACVVHPVENAGHGKMLLSAVVFEEAVCQTILAASQCGVHHTSQWGCTSHISVRVYITHLSGGVHHTSQWGCTSHISVRVYITHLSGGVHHTSQWGCTSPISVGVYITHLSVGVHHTSQ